jgi:UrcA family protein
MYRFTTMMMIFALALIHQAANADPAQVAVRFADLDLTRIEGATVLYHRLKQAAETVCTPLAGRNLENATVFKQCVQSGIEAAVTKVDRPMLTAYFQALSGNAPIEVAAR